MIDALHRSFVLDVDSRKHPPESSRILRKHPQESSRILRNPEDTIFRRITKILFVLLYLHKFEPCAGDQGSVMGDLNTGGPKISYYLLSYLSSTKIKDRIFLLLADKIRLS